MGAEGRLGWIGWRGRGGHGARGMDASWVGGTLAGGRGGLKIGPPRQPARPISLHSRTNIPAIEHVPFLRESLNIPSIVSMSINCKNECYPLKGESEIFDTCNTGFIMIATSLVMLMLPGLVLFYSGLNGRKIMLTIMISSSISMAIPMVLYVVYLHPEVN